MNPAVGGWMRALDRWVATPVLDLVYPPLCDGCGVLRDRDKAGGLPPLCEACESRLAPVVPPTCDRCGQPFRARRTTGFACANCRDLHLAFDFAVAPYEATGLLLDLVHAFKFGRKSHLRRPLAGLMSRALTHPRLAGHPWVMVPVPVHPRRHRERGFNQAHELAVMAGPPAGIPVQDVLKRTRYTAAQSRLGRKDRLQNLHGAFAFKRGGPAGVTGRPVLLVDDVLTTGSTASACAEILRTGGATTVAVLTLARG